MTEWRVLVKFKKDGDGKTILRDYAIKAKNLADAVEKSNDIEAKRESDTFNRWWTAEHVFIQTREIGRWKRH